MNLGSVPQNNVSPSKHWYGYEEWGYGVHIHGYIGKELKILC